MSDATQSVRRKKLAKKVGLPRHVKDMSKEQLEATIRKKRECNAQALTIVEQMLETQINEDWFLNQLKFIDVGHFQDIAEERALSKLCGYPLCSENLKSFPSQQFRISTKYNKVYDITERKNFCSNQCYKANKFVQDQLLTSPLWLRDKEDIPAFKLLPVGSHGTGAGEEVDLGQNDCLKSEITKLNSDEKFVSVTDYTQESIFKLSKKISDIDISGKNKNVDSDGVNYEHSTEKLPSDLKNTTQDQDVCAVQESNAKQEKNEITYIKNKENAPSKFEKQKEPKTEEKYESDCNTFLSKSKSLVNNVVKKDYNVKKSSTNKNEKELEEGNTLEKQKKSVTCYEGTEVTSSVIHIEKCLHEWFTIESMCFLFGEEKVKDLVSDKGECIKEYYKAVGKSSWDPKVQQRYEALCRRLNIMELQEEQFDKEERQLKPLPDYSVLKEEGQKLDVKIQAFFQGRTDYEIPVNICQEGKEMLQPSCVLPLVDIHAQNALRRRMVFDNLKRVLPDLLQTFGLSSRDISSELRCLIGSFHLSAHNITFNPAEWNLLGLIIIKMLSIKDMRLRMLLETQQGIKHQTMLLMAFQQDGGYLERLMVWLTDMDNLMKKS